MKLKIIDVSHHQGVIDWSKIKADGVMIRVGFGSWKKGGRLDEQFRNNINGAFSIGLPIGIYFYSYAITKEHAKKELAFVLRYLALYKDKITLPVAFDIEDDTQTNLDNQLITDIIRVFCDGMANAGFIPMLYSYKWFLERKVNLDQLYGIDIWLAEYTKKYTYKNEIAMWQYTSKGQMKGIDGNVDLNICYKNYGKEKKIMVLKKGSRGQAVERLQKDLNTLSYNCGIPDGIYGTHTKNAVYAFQKVNGLKKDGKAGPQTLEAIEDQIKQPMQTGKPYSAHFKFEEFKCRDGSDVPKEYWPNLQNLMNLLEQVRTACGNRPIHITSGYRTPSYNQKCGGAKYSQHLKACAADIQVSGLKPSKVYSIVNKINPNGGVGKYTSFTHLDIRGYRSRW